LLLLRQLRLLREQSRNGKPKHYWNDRDATPGHDFTSLDCWMSGGTARRKLSSAMKRFKQAD
jgi:hypothetical protein